MVCMTVTIAFYVLQTVVMTHHSFSVCVVVYIAMRESLLVSSR
jgi:hypothetical protein